MLTMMGALGIALGLACAGMAALSVLGAVVPGSPQAPRLPWTLSLWAPLYYLMLAAAFTWLGWGAMQARRWARDLWLVLSASGFVIGLASLVIMILILPGMIRGMTAAMPAPPGGGQAATTALMGIAMAVGVGIMGVFYVLLPGGMWWFYSRPSVRETCWAADPRPSWTEACPLPVLGAVLWLWFAALMMPASALMYRGWFPWFGVVLPKALGILAYLAITAALVLAGWWLYRRRMAGWWLAAGGFGLFGASWWVSLRRLGFAPMFEAMGYPEALLKLANEMLTPDAFGSAINWGFGIWGVVLVAVLLWIRPQVPLRRS